jgi:hypothetical protein
LNDANLSSPEHALIESKANFGANVNGAGSFARHRNAEDGLVKIWVELVAIVWRYGDQAILGEYFEQTRLGHLESFVHGLQLVRLGAAVLAWVGCRARVFDCQT